MQRDPMVASLAQKGIRPHEDGRAAVSFLIGVFPRLADVTGAMLKDIWLAIHRKYNCALVRPGFVERSYPTPDEFPGSTDAIMVIERSLDDVSLFDFGVLMHRQYCARLPFQKTGHFTLRLILIENLNRDAVEL